MRSGDYTRRRANSRPIVPSWARSHRGATNGRILSRDMQLTVVELPAGECNYQPHSSCGNFVAWKTYVKIAFSFIFYGTTRYAMWRDATFNRNITRGVKKRLAARGDDFRSNKDSNARYLSCHSHTPPGASRHPRMSRVARGRIVALIAFSLISDNVHCCRLSRCLARYCHRRINPRLLNRALVTLAGSHLISSLSFKSSTIQKRKSANGICEMPIKHLRFA